LTGTFPNRARSGGAGGFEAKIFSGLPPNRCSSATVWSQSPLASPVGKSYKSGRSMAQKVR
jgi:hypothetical protein